jgi:hypothetical protein
MWILPLVPGGSSHVWGWKLAPTPPRSPGYPLALVQGHCLVSHRPKRLPSGAASPGGCRPCVSASCAGLLELGIPHPDHNMLHSIQPPFQITPGSVHLAARRGVSLFVCLRIRIGSRRHCGTRGPRGTHDRCYAHPGTPADLVKHL